MSTTRDSQSFASKLRHYREAAGLSQEALAERAGLSARGVSDLERGLSRAPRLHTLSRLAEALHLEQADREDLLRASGRLSGPVVPDAPPPATPPGQTGLPAYLTPMLGREREEASLARLLSRDDVHLVTLIGPGGVGKTRLATHMATALMASFRDGVAFVGLAPLRDPGLVLTTIGQAIGLGDSDDSTLAQSILVALRGRQILLVIDNCEHVLEAAPAVAELLRRCAGVRVLATSRSRLSLEGEHTFIVRPLPLPIGETLAEITRTWSAVSFFVERAQAVRPDFKLADDNVQDVAAICRRLDGLPLALELAAAAVAFLPMGALRERLEQRLPIATRGPRDAPPRHRTVQATVAWSYDLLTDEERRTLRWLSVFRGGWTLELAESVVGAEGLLDNLASLVEHSLVQPAEDVGGGQARFDMLVTIGAHAYEQLQAAGESEAAHRAHAEGVLGFAEEVEPHLVSPDRSPWLRRTDLELDNVRAALSWSLSPHGDSEIGGRICGSLSWYWYLRGQLREGSAWSEQLIARLDPAAQSPGRARALFANGGTAIMLGDVSGARPPLTESMGILRALADSRRLTHAMTLLGLTMAALGEPSVALDLYEQSIAVARTRGDVWMEAYDLTNEGAALAMLGDRPAATEMHRRSLSLFLRLADAWGQGIALRAAAGLAAEQGDLTAARGLYEQSVPLFRETDDTRGLAQALLALGKVELRAGLAEQSRQTLIDSLGRWREVGIAAGVVRCLGGLAGAAAALAESERAVRLYAAAGRLAETVAITFAAADAAERDRTLADVRAALGEDSFGAALRDGEAMSLERAIRYALDNTRANAPR